MSVSNYFEEGDASITCKGINRNVLQGNATQCASFNETNQEDHVLQVVSEISVVDSMNFDDHPPLNLSSIRNNSQDDWSCGSESTNHLNLDNWRDNSGSLYETFSVMIFSISRFQCSLDLNSSNLKHNSPGSTLHVNDTRLQIDKDVIPSTSTNECPAPSESNIAVPVDIKGRSQVKCPLICEIDTNHQENDILNFNCQDSSAFKSPPASPRDNLFSLKSPSDPLM